MILDSNQDYVRKAREANLIDQGKTLEKQGFKGGNPQLQIWGRFLESLENFSGPKRHNKSLKP